MDTKKQIHMISVPVDMFIDEDGSVVLSSTEETQKLFGSGIVSHGKTVEEAEKMFWSMVESTTTYNSERSKELDKWKPLQIGPWKTIGGRWFTIFGIQFYFRKKSDLIKIKMVGGRFIPFTKWNVRVKNLWLKK